MVSSTQLVFVGPGAGIRLFQDRQLVLGGVAAPASLLRHLRVGDTSSRPAVPARQQLVLGSLLLRCHRVTTSSPYTLIPGGAGVSQSLAQRGAKQPFAGLREAIFEILACQQEPVKASEIVDQVEATGRFPERPSNSTRLRDRVSNEIYVARKKGLIEKTPDHRYSLVRDETK